MSDVYYNFIRDSETTAFDIKHREITDTNILYYNQSVIKGKEQYKNIELAKLRVTNIKHKIINDLDKYLIDFELNFSKNGGKVLWAQDKNEARDKIISILKKYNVKNVIKSKSDINIEIELNDVLKKNEINFLETDFVEYINELSGDNDVKHNTEKAKEDIYELLNKNFQQSINTLEGATSFVGDLLKDKFTSAEAAITGANFLISDIGAIAVTENQGNIIMSSLFPKIHIIVVGIEKIIPYVKDLHLFWPLLATYRTGQNITAYNSIITGPRQEDETDGSDELYVVLLDNGRSNLLEKQQQRRALSCINCGACLNKCPVYKNIGGDTYRTVYGGPIGSIITPYLNDMQDFKHLSFACTLCAKCTEVCPVKINLHELMLYNRRDFVKQDKSISINKFFIYIYRKMMTKSIVINSLRANWKNFIIKIFFKKQWSSRRKLPVIKNKSFNTIWREKIGIK